MRPPPALAVATIFGLATAGSLLVAGDPFSRDGKAANQASARHDAALGKLLFADVIYVSFSGPGTPANADGSLAGLAADENVRLTIHERFIVRDATDQDGTIYRTVISYDKLGRIEQRIARPRD